MARKKKTKPAAAPRPVDAIKHKADTRTNIPTCETAGLVMDDEAAPKTVHYPRDPSLDPQLVWKGKDEQDAKPLEVPAVPIYIQEKIQPQAIIEDLRQRAVKGKSEQPDLFADFNGIDDFEKRVDFYHHPQHWSNRMILGDSLFVMTSLAEKERLKGQVQMIYLDPPYGIKFGSNWQVSTRKREVKDAKVEDVTRQPEQIRAFRDTWQLGIHSYLSWLRDLLTAARDLLTETGSIFVQIGDENVHLVRCVMDEVFGSENCCGLIAFKKTGGQSTSHTPYSPTVHHNTTSRSSGKGKDLNHRPALIGKRPKEACSALLSWIGYWLRVRHYDSLTTLTTIRLLQSQTSGQIRKLADSLSRKYTSFKH